MMTKQEEKRRVLVRLASVAVRLERPSQESQKAALRDAMDYNVTNTEYIREYLRLKTALPQSSN